MLPEHEERHRHTERASGEKMPRVSKQATFSKATSAAVNVAKAHVAGEDDDTDERQQIHGSAAVITVA